MHAGVLLGQIEVVILFTKVEKTGEEAVGERHEFSFVHTQSRGL